MQFPPPAQKNICQNARLSQKGWDVIALWQGFQSWLMNWKGSEFAEVTDNEYLCIKLIAVFFEIFLALLTIVVVIPVLIWLASIVLPLLWEVLLVGIAGLAVPFMLPVALYKRWRRWYDRRQRKRRRKELFEWCILRLNSVVKYSLTTELRCNLPSLNMLLIWRLIFCLVDLNRSTLFL